MLEALEYMSVEAGIDYAVPPREIFPPPDICLHLL